MIKPAHTYNYSNRSSVIYNALNMDFMRDIPDNFFDWLVDDPPYFSGPEKRQFYGADVSTSGVNRRSYHRGDIWEVPSKEYFDEAIRISKNQIIWGCNYFDYSFGPGRIIWDKINYGSTFSDCEIAYCSSHDSVRIFRYMWNGMMQGKSIEEGHIMKGNKKQNEKRIHQTQKPTALYKWMFKKYLASGDKVLDNHLGSGSSRVAALNFDIDFVGVEKEPGHIDNHIEWFDQEVKIIEAVPKGMFR